MSIIKTHDITLYGGNDIDVVLRPLCDAHLPLLYKWNADAEVLYWCEEDDVRQYEAGAVRQIYGSISQNACCFLIEADGIPIGECWLQKMNLPDVIAQYPGLDVRRIDMMIGEKTYWNRGIGTTFLRMLIDYAFYGENVDVIHALVDDYNVRSRRAFEKNGLIHVNTVPLRDGMKAKEQIHLALTKQQFIQNHRHIVCSAQRFELPIVKIQPSQLYISTGKLRMVRKWFEPADKSDFDPIPIKEYRGLHLMTDGHTRAVAAYLAGWETIPVYWDEDALDMLAYAEDVRWCEEEDIRSVADLAGRVVSHKDYERLWRKRCMEFKDRLQHSNENKAAS